jgi:hypothetical protein
LTKTQLTSALTFISYFWHRKLKLKDKRLLWHVNHLPSKCCKMHCHLRSKQEPSSSHKSFTL